jgi:hypothetical protein
MATISGLLVVGAYYNMWVIMRSAFHLTNLMKTQKGDVVTGEPGQLSDSAGRAALRDDCSHTSLLVLFKLYWGSNTLGIHEMCWLTALGTINWQAIISKLYSHL